jgi:Phosphoglucose isomerase
VLSEVTIAPDEMQKALDAPEAHKQSIAKQTIVDFFFAPTTIVWNINSCDQWGAELGKGLANKLTLVIAGASALPADTDPSTAGLIAPARAHYEE